VAGGARRRHQPGDSVTLTLWRAGKTRKQALALAAPQPQ